MDSAYIQGMADDGDLYADDNNHDPEGHLNMATKPTAEDATVKNEPAATEALKKGASTALVNWKDRMIAIKEVAVEAEKPSGGFISFKGGRMTYGDEILPGDKLNVVIVNYRKENDFYTGKYVAGQVKSPDCYAINRPGEEQSPWRVAREGDDPDDVTDGYFTRAEAPQVEPGEGCDTCPQNEWGSADGGQGRGKACKTTRRLMVLAADDCTSPDKIAKAGVVTMIPPATSVDNFTNMMNQISKVLDTTMFGAVVEVSVKPHDKYLFMVHFKVLQQITNEGLLEALYQRFEKEEAREIEYPKNSERENDNAPPKQSGKY